MPSALSEHLPPRHFVLVLRYTDFAKSPECKRNNFILPANPVLVPRYTRFLLVADTQSLNKRRLGNFNLAELAHSELAFFLLVQQLALTGNVTAVTLGRHVFAQR